MMREAAIAIERACSAMWSLDPGTERDIWVRNAMSIKAAGIDFDDFHNWSAGARNYKNEAECRSVWNSIKDGGVTAASLFHAAMTNGWTDSTETPAERPQPRQNERREPEPSKPTLHDPLTLWATCKPVSASQEYIARKLGLPDGLKDYAGSLTIAGQACDGALVLPLYSLDGVLVSLQFIPPSIDAKKIFLPGCKLTSDACLILGGPVRDDRPVFITEGIGQAWSAHQATTAPAVCCFGVGRMAQVAKALRERYKAVSLVLVADGGKESQMAAIARDIHGAWVEMPKGCAKNYDLNDHHKEHGLDAVAALLERAQLPPQRFHLLTRDGLAELPPVHWRVRGVLPSQGIGAIFGASGSGKSFLVLDLLATVATGGEWFGCRVKVAPVLYVALEGEAGIAQRAKAYEVRNGALPGSFRFLLQSLDIRLAADRADLVQAIRAVGWSGGVLCLDTLNRAAPGMDENDSKSMGEVIGAAKAIQAAIGGLVLFVHHTGKDSTKGMRGHSSLHAALDAAVEVSRDGERREWKIHKAKDGEDGEARPFRLDVVEVGTDEDGEPTTSCVVAPGENLRDAVHRAKLPRGVNQHLVWDALRELLKANGERRPEGVSAELPVGRPAISLEAAIEGSKSRLVCDTDQRGYRAKVAINGLVKSGFLTIRDGWLWVS